MNFKILPAPDFLKEDIECIRIAEYTAAEPLALNVCLNGLPGIVFQHHDGSSPIDTIVTRSALVDAAPTLYVYGQMTEPSVMNHKAGPFKTIQVILKPHALYTLLGINASIMTDELVGLTEFSARTLNIQLLEAQTEQERLDLLVNFLGMRLNQGKTRDSLIEESLRLIHKNIDGVSVKSLLDSLSISERHFERRFNQTVGISPQFYIRVRRFNEAIRLIQTGQFETLTHVAYALNFYDQSHLIRDFKAFSGLTPKNLSVKVEESSPDQKIYSYV